MKVGEMRVGMGQRFVPVAVRVRLGYRFVMPVLVMFVMNMAVLMFQRRVAVFMRVAL